MSEKIIVLHPENQPEVDIYPIIKEGSIPNSVIDNQKIKSRTIINSNIALNTLKYEVLHTTLKELIDSKITQVNMENYLSSYYYNVEETQQYVGSEINTLHQTIQNEFYSNTTIDNMLMEKTDLSLFRQYLPSNYLNLTKVDGSQTSNLNFYATGNIFLNNFGDKNNSSNYYLPNSLVKTEDAEHGYFVLSTTNDNYQSLYNLGAYDKITTNSDGTYTITRQTGYIVLDGVENKFSEKSSSKHNGLFYNHDYYVKSNALIPNNTTIKSTIICNLFETKENDYLYRNNVYGVGMYTNGAICVGLTTAISTIDEANAYLVQNPISIQYKLVTSYTEKVEANHYARYNERFILDHNKSEAERSSNLFNNPYNYSGTNNGVSINIVGNECVLNGTLTEGFFKVLGRTTLKAGTYSFSQVVLSGSINGDINAVKFGLCGYDTSFPLGVATGTYTLTQDTTLDIVVWFGTAGITFNNCKLAYMLNEGSVALPYQAYEGKTIHEKDLGNYTNIYNVSQLYKHDYELENQVGDTIYVTCWSTQNTKILLKDITRYAFSNVQVYNSSAEYTIQVIKWGSSGFNFINDNGNIDGNSYTVIHYYINGEPTTY